MNNAPPDPSTSACDFLRFLSTLLLSLRVLCDTGLNRIISSRAWLALWDKVHPPRLLRICIETFSLIPPAASSHPQPPWKGCAHMAPRSLIDLPPEGLQQLRRPGSVGVIPRSSAAHSTGQSVGVRGVFSQPCQQARGASFTSLLPPPTARPL